MAGERGSYRSVKVVLLDGPDFQQLPERANHLFVFLKLTFGPSGIEVRYPDALAAEMSAKTRIPVEFVRENLDILEQAGWIEREGNVVWILGQLEHDPGQSPENPKHRTGVQRHVDGLPRLPIVEAFKRAHPLWFPTSPQPKPSPPESIPMPEPIDSQSIANRFTEEGRQKTEERIPNTENRDNSGGRLSVEKSKPMEPIEHTTNSVSLEAHAILGMGTWGDELSPKFNETRGIVVRRWMASGISLASVHAAIHGLRKLVDRGDIEWLADRKGKPLDGLEVLLKNAVVPGPDGTQLRPLFDLAQEAYYAADPPQKRQFGKVGPTRINVAIG